VRYWNAPGVVQTYSDHGSYLHWYEGYLVHRAAAVLTTRFERVTRVHVVGCGAGREIPSIRAAFPGAQVIASDVAPRMVDACQANLRRWGHDDVDVRCCAVDTIGAPVLAGEQPPAQLVVLVNNLLTYITPSGSRTAAMRAVSAVLERGGLAIGVVHHRWGRPAKSGYFLLQGAARTLGLAKREAGDRVLESDGMTLRYHYFTADELRADMATVGLAATELQSLAQLGRKLDRRYRALRGDNNLVFLADRT
jgi:SAM-dependent methyltransferase